MRKPAWSTRALRWACVIALALGGFAPAPAQDQITRDLEAVAGLVVSVEAKIGERRLLGAGVVVARPRDAVVVVTANHVVRQASTGAGEIAVRFKGAPQKALPAVLLPGFDRSDDIAVFRVDGLREHGIDACALPPPRFESRLVIRRGHGVFPIGNPAGVAWRVPARADEVTEVNERSITFQSALIESGHSGGGLFNAFGDLIGIIKADQPPYGLATRLDRVMALLRGWGLLPETGGIIAGSPADVCAEPRRPGDSARPAKGSPDLRLTKPEQWGLEYSDKQWIPLFLAVQQGQLDEVRRLAGGKALDPDGYHPPFPLHWAAAFGQVEVVKQLLLMGAKKNSWVRLTLPGSAYRDEMGTPLHVATRASQLEVMRVLIRAGAAIEEGADLSDGPGSPLALAARTNMLDAARLLIAAGADVESGARYTNGWAATPMARAVAAGHVDMIKLLERSKARLNGDDSNGGRPALLRVAVRANQLEALRYLIARGVPLECSEHAVMCESPLYEALTDNRLAAIQVLLDAGANPNAGSYKLPLQVAIEFRNLPALKLLLKTGANPNLRTREGKSMLALAVDADQNDAAAALRAYGAQR